MKKQFHVYTNPELDKKLEFLKSVLHTNTNETIRKSINLMYTMLSDPNATILLEDKTTKERTVIKIV